ncbi:MAG: hypothetical protein ACRC0A_01530 [Chitinophagaceae bacterium]
MFSNTSTSSTLIESLNWRTAYKADTNAIDFQKIWNDIIAFSPTKIIALAKNNILSIYQSNVMIEDMQTKENLLMLSQFNLQTTPLKNGFITLSNFNVNQLPIDLKFDVESTTNKKLRCNNFQIKSLYSILNMKISLSHQNDLYSTIKTKIEEQDIQTFFPTYQLKQPIKMDIQWSGNFDTGHSKIQLQIPTYIDVVLNNQYAQKNNQYAVTQQIEQCKWYGFSDTTKMNLLYPALQKWYPYFITDIIDIRGQGYWYNNSWIINTEIQHPNGFIAITGNKQMNDPSFFNYANIRMDIDSFCFTNIFNKGIYNTSIIMNFDSVQGKLKAHIDKIVLKNYEFKNMTINDIFLKNNNLLNINIQDNNIRVSAIFEHRKLSNKHALTNIKSTLENVKIEVLKNIALDIFKDSSLLILRDSVSVFGKIEASIEEVNNKKNIILKSPKLAFYSSLKEDYFYLYNIEYDYQDKANEDVNIGFNSNLITGRLQCNKKSFSLQRIANYFINTYITNYTFKVINKKDTTLSDFIFLLKAYNLKSLNHYFSYPLRNIDTLDVGVLYQENTKKITANVLVKNLEYGTLSLQNFSIKNEGKEKNLDFRINMDQLMYNEYNFVGSGNLQFQVKKNNLSLNISTDNRGILGNVHFDNELLFLKNHSVCLKINDIAMDVLKRKYRTNKKGVFYWGNHVPFSDSFLSVQEVGKSEQLIIRPIYDEEAKKEIIQVTLSELDLSGFNDFLKSFHTKLNGLFTFQCNIRNMFNRRKETFIDYKGFFKNLVLNNIAIGNPVFTGNYYPLKKDIYYDIKNEDRNFEISSIGHINFGDKKSDIALNITSIPIGFIQPYITTVFDYIDANVQGNINISQRSQNISINGDLNIPKVLLKIAYTQVNYVVDTMKILLRDSLLFFDETIFQTNEGSQDIGYIKGNFLQKNLFSYLQYGVHIRTPGIMVFNTDMTTGDVYSLVAKAKGTFDITGNNKEIFLRAKAYPLEGAKIVIYSSRSTETNSLGSFITFKNYKTKDSVVQRDSTASLLMDILIDIDLQSTIAADIWTSNTGDQKIQTQGIGTLRVISNPQNHFGLYGIYNIEKGSYNLPIEYAERLLLVDSRFNNYIEWTGDVNGKVSINLIYNIPNADFNALISSNGTSSTSSLVIDQFRNFKGPVDILMKVSNSLLKPSFKFDLEIPSSNVLKNNPETKTFFDRIQGNETELLRQASYLFITNSFAPPDNMITSSIIVSGVTGALSSAVSSQINNLLAKPFGKISPTLKFNIITDLYGVNSSGGNFSNTLVDRMKFGASISQNLFDNRFSYFISTAGDFGLGNTTNKATFLPDAEARYNIKKDGSIYVRAFINNSISQGENYSYGKNSRQGGGVGFRKEFNSFKDLFTFKKDTTKNKKKAKIKLKKDTISN